jgi:hypothetical protein
MISKVKGKTEVSPDHLEYHSQVVIYINLPSPDLFIRTFGSAFTDYATRHPFTVLRSDRVYFTLYPH